MLGLKPVIFKSIWSLAIIFPFVSEIVSSFSDSNISLSSKKGKILQDLSSALEIKRDSKVSEYISSFSINSLPKPHIKIEFPAKAAEVSYLPSDILGKLTHSKVLKLYFSQELNIESLFLPPNT